MELRQQEGVAARALEFTILTAARTDRVIGVIWAEIDLEARLWTIPSRAHESRARAPRAAQRTGAGWSGRADPSAGGRSQMSSTAVGQSWMGCRSRRPSTRRRFDGYHRIILSLSR